VMLLCSGRIDARLRRIGPGDVLASYDRAMPFGKIAVLGGGGGSLAVAGDLALRGFEVHFWARNARRLATVVQFREIRMVGYPEGVGVLADATDDLERVLRGAQLVVVSLPGSAHDAVAERCAPFVEDGQVFLVSSNAGMSSLRFASAFRRSGRDRDV